MPELPEVQTIVDDLIAAGIIGHDIVAASVYWPGSVAGLASTEFCRRITGRRLTGIRRRGKYIVIDLQPEGTLLIHLRMSGRILLTDPAAPRLKHQHVILELNRRCQVRFQDPRKFGRLHLVRDAKEILNRLGPEPLEASFRASVFGHRLRLKKRAIKPLLLDQHFIAGLGNIYVDEALWDARIHPLANTRSLSDRQIIGLHRSIRKVLRVALKYGGTALGNGLSNFHSIGSHRGQNRTQLKVFRRTGQACLRCGHPIERLMVGQRSTHICPRCQIQLA
jgi:formamidopyrimidine-DNA glycosylase